MKGVILAGGMGTRLNPLTKVTNKCLLPVYNKPMIYYPIEFLVASNVVDILLVCGGNAAGEFLRVLGNGEQFGLKHLHYTYQADALGIAHALWLAREFVGDDDMCVVLADNVFENDIRATVEHCRKYGAQGAIILGTEVEHPEHYGVIMKDHEGKVVGIIEKPKNPQSNWIATGLYIYDKSVWGFIDSLSPSARGELEITDVNNHYIKKNALTAVDMQGWWADCGENFDGYLDACNKARELSRRKAQHP